MPSTINLKEKTGYEGLRGSVNRCNLQFSAGSVDEVGSSRLFSQSQST